MKESIKESKSTPLLPDSYNWGQLILIGLSVLSIGLAIAFLGYFLTNH